jgi:hypothetical protein
MNAIPPELDVAINLGGLGDIDMYTGMTVDAMDTLARAGQTFNNQWKDLLGKIQAEEAALSGGSVRGDMTSKAFRENYNLVAPALMAGADGLGPMFDQTAQAGRNAVAIYLEMDGRVATALRIANRTWL